MSQPAQSKFSIFWHLTVLPLSPISTSSPWTKRPPPARRSETGARRGWRGLRVRTLPVAIMATRYDNPFTHSSMQEIHLKSGNWLYFPAKCRSADERTARLPARAPLPDIARRAARPPPSGGRRRCPCAAVSSPISEVKISPGRQSAALAETGSAAPCRRQKVARLGTRRWSMFRSGPRRPHLRIGRKCARMSAFTSACKSTAIASRNARTTTSVHTPLARSDITVRKAEHAIGRIIAHRDADLLAPPRRAAAPPWRQRPVPTGRTPQSPSPRR